MKTLAAFCYTRRRYIVIGWIVLLAGIFVLSQTYGGEPKTEFKLPGSESQEAIDLLEEEGVSERTGFFGQVVFRADQGVGDPTVQQTMESFFVDIERNVEGVEIVSPYEPENAHQIAENGEVAYAEINFSDRDNEAYADDADVIKGLHEEIDIAGLRVELGGFIFAEEPDFSSELVGVGAAVIILLIAFGSILAMGLPILTALFGVGTGAALIGLAMTVLNVPEFTTAVAAMIGIGVGIDYALLVVTRYRQALDGGLEPQEAVGLSLDTSGRAVVFAGLTVVIALFGMFMMDLEFMRSIAIGAILAVLMTMLASITLLPAVLGFVGRNIDRFGLPHRASASEHRASESFWHRWGRLIQKHPWPAFIGSAALLILLAIPVFSIRLGFGDAGNFPESDTTRRAYDLLSEGFGPGFNGPILVVAETPNGDGDAATVGEVRDAVAATEGVASVTEPRPVANGAVYLFNVFPTSAPQDEETADLVHRLRDDVVPPVVGGGPAVVRLSGDTPFVIDFSDYVGNRLPLFIGAVLVLSFLLLLAVFHSLVVAAKAVLMNMLSIGAAFGAVVGVFQWGFMDNLLGLGKEGPIEAWAPMMLFAIVFGLSMDYEVFLLTRIREEYDRTGDNGKAVADGLAATGRVITAAAAIMICVFGAFVLGEGRDLKLLGFGLAFAIFLDATVVRLVLVPALMELLGDINWYLPSWLRWLPSLRVEAAPVGSPATEPVAGGGAD